MTTSLEPQLENPSVSPVSESAPRSRAWVGIAIIAVLALAFLGWFFFVRNSYAHTLEYTFYDPQLPMTFRYPDTYCVTQDIGAVIVHDKSSPCGGNNSVNTKDNFLLIYAFPQVGVTTTKELVDSKHATNELTGNKRTIGGYEALELKDPSGQIGWVFMTDYSFKLDSNPSDPNNNMMAGTSTKYGVVIGSKLPDTAEGRRVLETVLSSLKFTHKP